MGRKTVLKKADRECDALERLYRWSYNAGLTLHPNDLRIRANWLHKWLTDHNPSFPDSLVYQEREQMFLGYYDAAVERGLIEATQ